MLPHTASLDTQAAITSDAQAFTLLRDITAAVNSSLILDDIFDALGEVLRQYFPYREATIVVFDETLNGIKLMVRMLENGLLDFRSEHNRFTGDDPLLRQLIFQSQSLNLTGAERVAQYQPSIVLPPWATTALVVPLVNKGVMLGVLALSTDATPADLTDVIELPGEAANAKLLTPAHLELLQAVTPPIAVAMENAKLYWQTQQQAGREFLVNQITKAIRQSLAVEDILTTATETLGRTTGVNRCILRYFGEPLAIESATNHETAASTGNIYLYATSGTPTFAEADVLRWDMERKVFTQRLAGLNQQAGTTFPLSHDIASVLNPFILNDVQDCPPQFAAQASLSGRGIQSLAMFPICVGQACVGAITLHQCDQLRVWLEEDLALFGAIAEHLGLALNQAALYAAQEAQTQQLRETLDELQQAQLQLIQSEKMAVIGQFVAGIAHEVNTPLGAITSNQQTLQACVNKIKQARESSEAVSETVLATMDKLLNVNQLAATRIDEIVRNLRNFARLDESDMKTINLRDSLHSTGLLLERSLKDAGITLTEQVAEDTPHLTCYPGLLNQVLMNVIVNAIHALEGTEKPAIHIAIAPAHTDSGDWMHIDVIDNGPGIPPEIQKRVFDPGFTTKGVGVGTGLGLALCYRIMDKHNGRIEIANSSPAGTTMRLVLPLK